MRVDNYKGFDIEFFPHLGDFVCDHPNENIVAKTLAEVHAKINKAKKKTYVRTKGVIIDRWGDLSFRDVTSVRDGKFNTPEGTIYGNEAYKDSEEITTWKAIKTEFEELDEKMKEVSKRLKAEALRLKSVLAKITPEMIDPSLKDPSLKDPSLKDPQEPQS
jgi:hypothetical protein